jgi:hypothetical protein
MATATYDRAQVAQQWGAYFQKRLDALEAAKALGMPWGWPEGTTWEQAALDLEAFFRQRPAVGTMLQVWPQAEQIMARPQETWTPDERRIVQAWTEPAIEHYMAQNPNVERVLAPHRQAGESWMDLMGREPEIGRALGQVWSGGQASGQAGLEGLSEEDLDPYDAEGMAQTLNRERRAFRQEMTAAQQEIAALEQHADAQAHFQKTLQDINDFERQVIYAPNSAHAATYQRDQLAAAMRDHHELNPWKAWEIDNAPKARE